MTEVPPSKGPGPLWEGTVDDVADGLRLDRALAGWLDEPRSRAAARCEAGEVRVDGAAALKSHRLQAGQRVAVSPPPAPVATAAPPQVPIRWRDDHIAVVAKPADLVVHPGAGTRAPTLVDALRAQGVPLADVGDDVRPGIVHRLDRNTTGLLVVACSVDAVPGLLTAFRNHDVERAYDAIVDGVPRERTATIDAPLGRHPEDRRRFHITEGGRRAVTHYDVTGAHTRAAVLRVRLETGRTHQVRVHLSAIGHPVTGDAVYGADAALARDLSMSRPALHAARIGFAHPVTGEAIVVDEPLPDDHRAALERLRGST